MPPLSCGRATILLIIDVMEIFFCSHCNQSIPLKDVQSGAAELRRGKYLCVTCKEIMPSSEEIRPNYVAMVLGIFLVGSLAVIAFLVFQDDLFPSPRLPHSTDAASSKIVLDRLTELESRSISRVDLARKELLRHLGDLDERLARQDEVQANVVKQVKELGNRPAPAVKPEDVAAVKQSVGSLAADVARLEGGISTMKRAVDSLREDVNAALDRMRTPPTPAEPVISAKDRWIALLGDEAMDKRFNALAQLSDYKGPDVVEALVGRLKDKEFFIRRWVAEDLGERKAVAAVPALVEALADEEVTVRTAAVVALRKITGKNFGFKSTASGRERDRALTRWRNFVAELARKK